MINPVWKYIGGTPGADTTERDIFNTVTAFGSGGAGALRVAGVRRLLIGMNTSGALNLRFYQSSNGGTSWTEDTFYSRSHAAGVNQWDYAIEHAANSDFKLTATNAAASAQTTYDISITGLTDRSISS